MKVLITSFAILALVGAGEYACGRSFVYFDSVVIICVVSLYLSFLVKLAPRPPLPRWCRGQSSHYRYP